MAAKESGEYYLSKPSWLICGFKGGVWIILDGFEALLDLSLFSSHCFLLFFGIVGEEKKEILIIKRRSGMDKGDERE